MFQATVTLSVGLTAAGCSTAPGAQDNDQEPAACAPTPAAMTHPQPSDTHAAAPPTAAPVELQGQMSIKLGAFQGQPAKGLSLGFFFSGNIDRGQLDLMTLMGSEMAKVNWDAAGAWLTNDKGRHRYEDLDDLSIAALGESLPLRPLIHWMQGQPAPDLPSHSGPTPDSFVQAGWIIDTHELPQKKLLASRDATPGQRPVQIKVYLDR